MKQKTLNGKKISLKELTRVLEKLKLIKISDEFEIHKRIMELLELEHIPFLHEYSLGKRKRVDFYIDGIVLEVKKGESINKKRLHEQIIKYSSKTRAIILITRRTIPLPDIEGVPVVNISLNKNWGVAV